jgi:RNA polymerase sigma-70 factor, ECF subfamily
MTRPDPLAGKNATRARHARFDALFHEHVDAVRRYVHRRDPALCDDVVAETFLVAWRRLDDVPADARPWLIGVARKTRLNMLRSRRRQAAVADRLGAALAPPTEGELPPDVSAALAQLRSRDREILLLAVWDDLERSEIARVLGCSTTAAAVRLHRAKKRFVAALTAADGVAGPTTIPGGATDAC